MKKIISILLLTSLLFLLSGCGKDKSLTEGKWTATYEGMTITRQFNDDGTTSEWSLNNVRVDGTYTVDGDKISATYTNIVNETSGKSFPTEVEWEWSYSIKGDKLTLVDLINGDGEDVEFTLEK